MPTLTWLGKDKVVSHHNDVPFRVLDPQYTAGTAPAPGMGQGNAIIHGDNLEALKALLPYYEGRIKCIYIDPPYNTGNENWVYNDNVNDPKIKRWLGKVVGKESEDLSRHDKWLCMMYPRLVLLHRLLADDGVIFTSLDENEVNQAKLISDEIFGKARFIAQLSLLCNPKGRSQDKYFSTNHEYCLVYAKNELPKGAFSISKDQELINKEYRQQDVLGQYRFIELRNTHREFNRQTRPNLFYPLYVDPSSGKVSTEESVLHYIEVYPLWPDGYEGCWTWGKDLSKADKHLLFAEKRKGRWVVSRKAYATNEEGDSAKRKPFTIWNDSRFYTEKGQNEFGKIFSGLTKNDFPQPKSVDFIEELLRTTTGPDDIILDSFAGSGTTAHAVLNLNKLDGGNRKFILVEMEDYAETITAERVRRVMDGYSDKPGTGGSFIYYELGEPLFTDDGLLNANLPLGRIREYIWYSETRSALPRRIAFPRSVSPQTSLASAGDSSGERVCEDTDLGEQSPFPRSVSPQTSLASAGDSSGERVCEDTDLGSEEGEPDDVAHFLGKFNDTAYYFYYDPDALTTVDYAFMATLQTPAGQYVIYADNCLIAREWLQEHRIIFKKIPRDISRF